MESELASDEVFTPEVVESDEAIVLVAARPVVEMDSIELLDCIVAVVSGVVVEAEVLSSDEGTEVVSGELTLDERLREVEESASDEVLLFSVELEESVNVDKLLGFVEELKSEVVLREDEIPDSVKVIEAVEKLVSLKLLRSVELEVYRDVVLGSKEKLDSDVDVSVEAKI
ncbi:hypothetical protein CGRA01v4_09322 [Colletotrichum graminicola]|uniref:Uncharacterized protein n=1 Tax=Colletotrichum graminicola (strain M1.001 / M2 / FGSC 10212) TaxID=645133 RepID=E3QPF2_COLGM|nr:uncharacterized protein GLRG_07884 [Colletotrichum graminicola M1.001]EFQ32740.1 hypothetical protein GLRG_07884 [Colletotrichum graminicola M1.001]WDK18037.1 hypothetical protein CGRA01v4_09322 [Colletotrichum graminicola]